MSFIEANDASRARLESFVHGLTDEELRRPTSYGGTVAGLLAHLAFWERRVTVLLRRWQAGGVDDSPVDPDMINDALAPILAALSPRVAAELCLVAAAEAHDRPVKIFENFIFYPPVMKARAFPNGTAQQTSRFASHPSTSDHAASVTRPRRPGGLALGAVLGVMTTVGETSPSVVAPPPQPVSPSPTHRTVTPVVRRRFSWRRLRPASSVDFRAMPGRAGARARGRGGRRSRPHARTRGRSVIGTMRTP